MKEKIITTTIIVLILICLLILFNQLNPIIFPQPRVILEQVWQRSDDHQLIRVVIHYQEETFYLTPEWWKENKDNFKEGQIYIRWVLLEQ